MIWTEGGGPTYGDDWTLRPMQIGVRTDPGITDVVTGPEMKIIAPPEVRNEFSAQKIKSDAETNIQAGLALLHLKLAFFLRRPVLRASDASSFAATRPGAPEHWKSFGQPGHPANHHRRAAHAHAARGHGSSDMPVPKQYIAAWLPFCPVTLYQRYNIGDAAYANKLEFCLSLMR